MIIRINAGIAPLKTWFRQFVRKMYVATLPAKIPQAGDVSMSEFDILEEKIIPVKNCHETKRRPRECVSEEAKSNARYLSYLSLLVAESRSPRREPPKPWPLFQSTHLVSFMALNKAREDGVWM
jgi:hypothetical protein